MELLQECRSASAAYSHSLDTALHPFAVWNQIWELKESSKEPESSSKNASPRDLIPYQKSRLGNRVKTFLSKAFHTNKSRIKIVASFNVLPVNDPGENSTIRCMTDDKSSTVPGCPMTSILISSPYPNTRTQVAQPFRAQRRKNQFPALPFKLKPLSPILYLKDRYGSSIR